MRRRLPPDAMAAARSPQSRPARRASPERTSISAPRAGRRRRRRRSTGSTRPAGRGVVDAADDEAPRMPWIVLPGRRTGWCRDDRRGHREQHVAVGALMMLVSATPARGEQHAAMRRSGREDEAPGSDHGRRTPAAPRGALPRCVDVAAEAVRCSRSVQAPRTMRTIG